MVQQSIVNAKGQHATRNIIADHWGRIERTTGRTSARVADSLAHEDHITLADGQVLIVPRANLAAAKGLLAAQRAAERRVATQRAAQLAALNATNGQTQVGEPIGAASHQD
ncbi:MAG TPA: hypothetical protein VMV29_16670 [Ktedonobacterales bacterium]|nr:hypothetical protein [Ktedonobacterales bacterium]